MGALDFMSAQFAVRQNLTYVFTEVPDLEDDTDSARMFQDVVSLALEHGGSIVVITTKSVWSQLQRKGMSITLDPPNVDEMLAIVKEQLDPYRGQIQIEWDIQDEKEAAGVLAGLTRIEAENVIATLLADGAVRKQDLIEIRTAKDRIFADISGIERVDVRQQDLQVGGLQGLKSWLEEERTLLTDTELRQRNLRPPRGVLLVGVPGCGKSLSAKAIAHDWQMRLYRLDLASIHGQYLGQSEGRLKEALATADHMAPCVLWIDEIEKGLAGAAGGGDGGTSTRMVGQFLYWLQESTARVFVVATANDVSRLPPELLRRGRFDEMFFVDLPSPLERTDIIKIYMDRGKLPSVSQLLMDHLVEISDGFSGADIESAVRQVTKMAYLRGDDCVTEDLYRSSFMDVVPLLKTSPEQIEAIRTWGRERAVPASGQPIGGAVATGPGRRGVLVGTR